jgi:hypothetical protein
MFQAKTECLYIYIYIYIYIYQQDGHCTYDVTLTSVIVTVVAAKSSKYCNVYSECVSVAFVIQHAMRMRRIILPSVACPDLPYLYTLSHKRDDFLKKKLLNLKYVF